jgi:hypothetical protein
LPEAGEALKTDQALVTAWLANGQKKSYSVTESQRRELEEYRNPPVGQPGTTPSFPARI